MLYSIKPSCWKSLFHRPTRGSQCTHPLPFQGVPSLGSIPKWPALTVLFSLPLFSICLKEGKTVIIRGVTLILLEAIFSNHLQKKLFNQFLVATGDKAQWVLVLILTTPDSQGIILKIDCLWLINTQRPNLSKGILKDNILSLFKEQSYLILQIQLNRVVKGRKTIEKSLLGSKK